MHGFDTFMRRPFIVMDLLGKDIGEMRKQTTTSGAWDVVTMKVICAKGVHCRMLHNACRYFMLIWPIKPSLKLLGLLQHVGIQILDALQAMHERGYIHRDVKPPNFTFSLINAQSALDGRAFRNFPGLH